MNPRLENLIVLFTAVTIEVLDNEDLVLTADTQLAEIEGMSNDWIDVISMEMEMRVLGRRLDLGQEVLTLERFGTVGGYLAWLTSQIPRPERASPEEECLDLDRAA